MLPSCHGAQAKVGFLQPSGGNVGLLGIEMQILLGKNFNSRLNFTLNLHPSCLQYFQFMAETQL